MGNFLGLFSLISENSGIGINTDILETGLINIIILVAGVIFLGRDFLSSALGSRREAVLASIQEAEDNLSVAKARLEEAEKQQVQTYVTGLVLKRVTSQLEKQVTPSVQSKIIDNEISCLGGQL